MSIMIWSVHVGGEIIRPTTEAVMKGHRDTKAQSLLLAGKLGLRRQPNMLVKFMDRAAETLVEGDIRAFCIL